MRRIVRNGVVVPCWLVLASACSSAGSGHQPDMRPVRHERGTGGSPSSVQGSGGGDPGAADPVDNPTQPEAPRIEEEPSLQLIIPTDTRKPRAAKKPPVPISGGTLIATADNKYAVAADPDRDRVSVVDIAELKLVHTIELEAGDEPGRLVEDDVGHVHVALRRGGAVASFDLASGELIARREVCAAPRGIAFDASARVLRVACATGELVTLPVDGGEASERLQLDSDLRDVLITEAGMVISRFKAAELMRVPNGSSTPEWRGHPKPLKRMFTEVIGHTVDDILEPEVAWRTVSDGHGGSLMLHQGAREGELAVPKHSAAVDAASIPTDSPYGGSGCQSAVQTELTRIDGNGNLVWTKRVDATLAVDVAISPVTQYAVIVEAGVPDPDQPMRSFSNVATDDFNLPGNVNSFPLTSQDNSEGCAGSAAGGPRVAGQPTAVAFTSTDDDTLLVQTREPATVTIQRYAFAPIDGPSPYGTLAGGTGNHLGGTVDLGGDSVFDTGHELFHRDAGGRIACASCHAEGGDDGHIWQFAGVGPRRTLSVNVGLEGTEPFHWSGDEPDIAALVEDVFVSRMGGVHESMERTDALQRWLFAQSPLPAQRAPDDEAALRGKALFEGDAGCAACHSGAKFTNDATVDVGTGEALQVPSLRGVGYRAPLMHDGCAATLRDRFDPKCGGGDEHGKTTRLSSAQVDDLIAYLQTL